MSHGPAHWDDLLTEQRDYYRARAGEYDQWWLRQGRYDRGPDFQTRWTAEVQQLTDALTAFGPRGRVLELACGTGIWTQRLAPTAERMTAIDASAEMIAIARSRPECAEVAFEQADIFSWNNTTKYDVVFFSFWLSHVPPDLFEGFWNVVRDSLKPAGRAFFIDSATFELPRPDYDGVTDLRTLNNGDQYQIVKVLYGPEQLSEKLSGMGWTASISSTEGFFLYGSARPR